MPGTDGSAEIVDELRRELDRLSAAAAPQDDGGDVLMARARAVAATRQVTGDHAAEVAPGRMAPAKRATKEAIRKATRWYVERLALDVRRFADATSSAIGTLAERVTAIETDQGRELAALRDRVARLERDRRTARPAAAAAPARTGADDGPVPSPAVADLDYFAFETRMRGSRDDIRERQRDYVAAFADAGQVLDIGCGRGEFLELLRDAGVAARGIDVDEDMVEQCRAVGLEADLGDGVAHLAGLPEGSLGGVFAAQVVEHLPPGRLVALLDAARRALGPNGVIVLETINPASISALRNYFADLTHAQPVVAETLAFLVESAGFRDVRVEYRSPLPEEARLRRVPLEGPAAAAEDHNVDRLNALLFAPQDYAVIART